MYNVLLEIIEYLNEKKMNFFLKFLRIYQFMND